MSSTLIDQLSARLVQNGTSSSEIEQIFSLATRTTCPKLKATPSSSSPTLRRARLSYSRRNPLEYLALSGHRCLGENEVLVKLPGRHNPIGVVVDLENNRWA